MTDLDFNDLALLWREEPGADERREFRDLVGNAARRAWLVQYGELGFGLLLIGAVLAAMSLAPAPATLATGALSVAMLAWSSWRRHLLHDVSLLVATSDRSDLVGHAIADAQAKSKRAAIGLVLFLPSVLLGAMLAHSYAHGGLEGFWETFARGLTGWSNGIMLMALLSGSLTYLIRSHARLRGELTRLHALREDYREEARLDALTAPSPR